MPEANQATAQPIAIARNGKPLSGLFSINAAMAETKLMTGNTSTRANQWLRKRDSSMDQF
jgi:hypothetical protein